MGYKWVNFFGTRERAGVRAPVSECPATREEFCLDMEIAIAWLTIASLIMLMLGLIDPGTALFWSKEKTRKRAAMVYGYVFFVMIALSVIFFPRTNLESRIYTLMIFCVIALAAGFVNPRLALPWMRFATKKSVALFYFPPLVLLGAAVFYAGMSKPVDPRYDIPAYEMSEAGEPELIEYSAASVLRGENNIGVGRVREVQVTDAPGGGYDVLVEYNMDDVVFVSFFKLKAEEDMTRIYKALYTSGHDIKNVTVTGYFPVGDRERKNPPVPVWTTTLGGAAARNVEWGEKDYKLSNEVLPKVWKTEYLHKKYE